MTELLKPLVEALRNELHQFGEMLARLDDTQAGTMRLAPDDLRFVQEQGRVLEAARQEREARQRLLARHLRQPEDAELAGLIERISPDYRPLFRALVDENAILLSRVQQRARQNHLLLRRSLEVMQQLIQTLSPSGVASIPGEEGHEESAKTAQVLCNAAA